MFALILIILLKIFFLLFMSGLSLCIIAENALPLILRIPLGALVFLLGLYCSTL